MKFLIDENIPTKLLTALSELGHDAVRVTLASSDAEIAEKAKKEGRVLVTLDKDFTNTFLYPPNQLDIIHVQIHPPYKESVIEAFQMLLKSLPPEKIKGLIILKKTGHVRISK